MVFRFHRRRVWPREQDAGRQIARQGSKRRLGGGSVKGHGEKKRLTCLTSPVVPRLSQVGTDSAVVCLVHDQRRVDSNSGRERFPTKRLLQGRYLLSGSKCRGGRVGPH